MIDVDHSSIQLETKAEELGTPDSMQPFPLAALEKHLRLRAITRGARGFRHALR